MAAAASAVREEEKTLQEQTILILFANRVVESQKQQNRPNKIAPT